MNNEDQNQETIDNAQVTDLTALIAAVNELIADHATNRTLLVELIADHATNIAAIADNQTQIDALVVDLGAFRTVYNATLAKLDADGGVTDTNYAATNPAAALTAVATSDAPAATLSASTAATLTATTITATAVAGS